MAQALTLNFRRPLSQKAKDLRKGRHERLATTFGPSAQAVTDLQNAKWPLLRALAVRRDFSYRPTPITDPALSDRRAPPRPMRPSATRISNSQGAALRLYLTCLALAQSTARPGQRAKLPDLPIHGYSGAVCWTDLLASKADSSAIRISTSVRDLKYRSLTAALDTLADARLVDLPHAKAPRNRYNDFALLHEAGDQLPGHDPVPYVMPHRLHDDYFLLPPGFITNGWVHILEDSELTVLLMLYCGAGALPVDPHNNVNPGEVAISGDTRLTRYGIQRDPYSSAIRALHDFGLLTVREIGRHDDGRAEDSQTQLHRLQRIDSGFDEPALPTVLRALAEEQQ